MALGLWWVFPTAMHAQEPWPGLLLRADAEYVYFTGLAAFPISDSWYLGGEGGFGFGRYLQKGPEKFMKYGHFGLIFTRSVWGPVNLDLGLRSGLGDFRPPPGSKDRYGHESEWFKAVLLGISVGGKRWRFGSRVSVGEFKGKEMIGWAPFYFGIQVGGRD